MTKFLAQLRQLATHCKFGNYLNEAFKRLVRLLYLRRDYTKKIALRNGPHVKLHPRVSTWVRSC